MRWRRHRDRQPYRPRPKVAKLSLEVRDAVLGKLRSKVDESPVLRALQVKVVAKRGRFYLERFISEKESFVIGRITPLDEKPVPLLLEVEYRNWKEVGRGSCAKVVAAKTKAHHVESPLEFVKATFRRRETC